MLKKFLVLSRGRWVPMLASNPVKAVTQARTSGLLPSGVKPV